MYILLQVLQFGVAWNDLLTETHKLKKAIQSYEEENFYLNESENSLVPQIEILVEKLFNLYKDFESSILLMEKNLQYEPIQIKVQQLKEIQASLTPLHNCHEERLL